MPEDVIVEIMEMSCTSAYDHLEHGIELLKAGVAARARLPSAWYTLSRGFHRLATQTPRLYRSILVVLDRTDFGVIENTFDVKRSLELGGASMSLSLIVDLRSVRKCAAHNGRGRRVDCAACEPWVEAPPRSKPSLVRLECLLKDVGARCQSLCFPLVHLPPRLMDASPALWPRLAEVSAYGHQTPSPELFGSGLWKAPLLERVYYLGFRDRTHHGIAIGDSVRWERIERATIAEYVEVEGPAGEVGGVYQADAARAVLDKGIQLRCLEVILHDRFPDFLYHIGLEDEEDNRMVTYRTKDGRYFAPLTNISLQRLSVDYSAAPWRSRPPSFFSNISLPNLTYLELRLGAISKDVQGDLLEFLKNCIGGLTVFDMTGLLLRHGDVVRLLRAAQRLEVLRLGENVRMWPWEEDKVLVNSKIPGRDAVHDCDGLHICDKLLGAMCSEYEEVCPRVRAICLVEPHATVDGMASFIARRKGVLAEVEIRCWGAVNAYGFSDFQKRVFTESRVRVFGTSLVSTYRERPLKRSRGGRWIDEVRRANEGKTVHHFCQDVVYTGWGVPVGASNTAEDDSGWGSGPWM